MLSDAMMSMVDGEPVIVIWTVGDFDEALDAARDMGLPVAGRSAVVAAHGYQDDDFPDPDPE